MSAGEAVDLGLVDNAAPDDRHLRLRRTARSRAFRASRAASSAGSAKPVTQARFAQLPLAGQLMHTVSSPPVAYLLFVIGLALILFELFTAGVGVAGLVGAGCLVLGCYGLAALPTNPVGVGLILFAMFGYAIDVQTGVPRVWSGIATVCFTVGLRRPLRRPVAVVDHPAGGHRRHGGGHDRRDARHGPQPLLDPHHRAGVDGRRGRHGAWAGWPRTASSPCATLRGGPAPTGPRRSRPSQPVRVVSIDGLLLEVEPVDGAARDHRDRR